MYTGHSHYIALIFTTNVLVDGDYNMAGIVDWSNTQTAPIERFAIIPEFIPPPAVAVTFK